MAWRRFVLLAGLCLAPVGAGADGLYLPGLGPSLDDGLRPGYREAYDAYPPPQHDILGLPAPPPSLDDRPSYRETYDDFPPPGGRYGGGFIEYVITGGRSLPVREPVAAVPVMPSYAAMAPRPAAASLPRSGLPEYAPAQPSAYYGRR